MIPIYVFAGGAPFIVDYLVVAGGGGGGSGSSEGGAGGGGGGFINSTPGEQSGGPSAVLDRLNLFGGTPLTVTVGAGGATGANGGDSRFGSIIATGGGRGASYTPTYAAGNGGSGGGGANVNPTGGSGTANQGNAGGDFPGGGSNFPATYAMGGGGGASEVGNTNSTSFGGDGLSSGISGSSVTYAGGGGGGAAQFVASGGSGGGGSGGSGDLRQSGPAPTAGATNLGGGGGGGGGPNRVGQNGGSGVVILRYPSFARVINVIDPGLTYSYSDDGTYKRYIFTSGTGNITF